MTTFGVFVPDEPEVHRDALLAVARGFDRRMIDYELYRLDQGYQPCEVVVTFGIAKAATRRGRGVGDVLAGHREQLVRRESETGKSQSRDTTGWDHLVIERGFVHRDRYFMLGWGG